MHPAWWRQLILRLSWSTKKAKKVPPYEKLAPIYDYIMKHVDYELWSNFAVDLIQRWHPNAKSILDTGCGTGNLLAEMKEKPFKLMGFDSSFKMVSQAGKKKDLENIPIWQANMTNFVLRLPVDVMLCFYDSINYIMTPESIEQFLNSAKNSLKPKGLLVFDICTERNAIEYFYNYYDHDKNKSFSYDRWSHYCHKKKIQFTEFKLRFIGDPVTYLEVHQQRIYSVPTILKLIKSSSFKLLDQYDEFSFRNPHPQSNRIHFVLQAKD